MIKYQRKKEKNLYNKKYFAPTFHKILELQDYAQFSK